MEYSVEVKWLSYGAEPLNIVFSLEIITVQP